MHILKDIRFKILMTAILLITVFSCCSFLYQANPWVDTNILFTCGRAVLDGKIIYLDIIDHKGPILFLIYFLAALISQSTYLGLYLIEIVSLFFYLYYSNKIYKLLFHNDFNLISIFFIGTLVVCSEAFKFGGGSAEEFMLPIMQASIYLVLKNIVNKQNISNLHCFIVGLLCSFVFLSKFILCGLYFGLFIVCFLYQYKLDKTKLFKCIIYAFLGFLALITIVGLYFISVGGFEAFIDVYFIKNLFGYGEEKSILKNLLFSVTKGAYILAKGNILLTISATVGLFCIKDKTIRNYIFIIFICWYLVTFIGGIYNVYYYLPISLFCIYTIGLFERFHYADILKGLIILICSLTSQNLPLLKDMMPVDKMINDQMQSIVNNPTFILLNCADFGVYMEANYLPECRYFTSINTQNDDYLSEVKTFIIDEQLDFYITRDEKTKLDGYELFDSFIHAYEGIERTYNLFINSNLIKLFSNGVIT